MHTTPDRSDAASLPFSIESRPDRSRIAVALAGELDLATVDAVEAEIRDLRAAGFSEIVLDLRALVFIDSTGLRLLLRWDEAARRDGFSFAIVDGVGPVRRLLEVTGLTERFTRGHV
ncbi:MAG: hypothetical protein JWQ48_3705 [Conexibacter sp.]|jgi:anti-anti-sigma factor|nr:hypothetical protein [Conexibacter sp.]